MPPQRPLLSVRQTADFLGLSEKQVYRLIERDQLQAVRIGSRLQIDPADIEEFIDQRRTFRVAADLAS